MRNLAGKRIAIAGGATGIGAATAERLAGEGAAVTVADINIEGAEATAARIRAAGGTACAIWFDLGDQASVEAMIAAMVSEFDGIDGLFNVGADLRFVKDEDSNVLDIDLAIWRHTLEVDLFGYVHGIRAALPHMLRQGGGTIVNTASGASSGSLPIMPAYGTAKAAVVALTRHVASRWGKEGVRCNAVSPGYVLGETQVRQNDQAEQSMILQATKSPRLGLPADIAATTAFLFSDDAEWINGQIWHVDGGLL
jgi:NAD(P)-dependent dehydrogenase (short-subunit alcohol dehydrogenase family)